MIVKEQPPKKEDKNQLENKPYKVILKCACKPHKHKRPTLTHEFATLEEMTSFVDTQVFNSYLGGLLEEYKIIIKKQTN